MSSQEWYAVLRHRRGNPETRYTVTCPYRYTLSTLPADGTLALESLRGGRKQIWRWPDTWYRSGFRRTWVRLGERGRRDPPAAEARRGESLFSPVEKRLGEEFTNWARIKIGCAGYSEAMASGRPYRWSFR
jgi:hypothetical protein